MTMTTYLPSASPLDFGRVRVTNPEPSGDDQDLSDPKVVRQIIEDATKAGRKARGQRQGILGSWFSR